MKLIRIKKATHPLFSEFYTLYEDAFPVCERRDKADFINRLETADNFYCRIILHDNKFAGFINTWHINDFIYIEHFAVTEELREQNIGGQILDLQTANTNQPIILEAEKPDTDIARRRIAFYKRHGFQIVNTQYMQPPYRSTDEPTAMYLLCTQEHFSDEQTTLFQQTVYGQK